jgi:hypothetical protein
MMKNTGVWARVELDDEGNLSVRVYAAAEWKAGETVTAWEDVEGKVPANLLSSIKSDLKTIINAAEKSIMEKAEEDAVTMANFMAGKKKEKTVQLDFKGDMQPEGSQVK